MGTNQAFGGSGSAEWERVREEWADLGSGGPGVGAGKGDAGEAEAPPGEDSSAKSPGLGSEDAYTAAAENYPRQ